jgi:hypothetical protein
LLFHGWCTFLPVGAGICFRFLKTHRKRTPPFFIYTLSGKTSAARDAQHSGNADAAAVYGLLEDITGFSPSFDTPESPYVPLFQMRAKRSMLPSDLSSSDVEIIREVAQLTKDTALGARLFDIIWETTKDHKALC